MVYILNDTKLLTCLTCHKYVRFFADYSNIKSHGIDKLPADCCDISCVVFVCFGGICEEVESRSVHLKILRYENKRKK